VTDEGGGTLYLTGSCFTDVSFADVYDTDAASNGGTPMDVSNGYSHIDDEDMDVYYVDAEVTAGDECQVYVVGAGGESNTVSYTASP
jgi:hypothetical protein